MEVNKIYRVVECDSNKSYFVRLRADGEFALTEFDTKEFNIGKSTMLSTKKYMLPGGRCVAMQEWDNSIGKSVISEITEENDIDYGDIQYIAENCSECNEKAYGIKSCSGELYYPTNYDELSIYIGKVFKFSIDGSDEQCGTIFEYKKHYMQQQGTLILGDTCYKTCDECGEEEVIEKDDVTIENRTLYAKSTVKSCGGESCQ